MGRTPSSRGGKPPPSLQFFAKFRDLCSQKALPKTIESLSVTNVVLLSTLTRNPAQSYRHGCMHRGTAPPTIATSDKVAQLSHEPAGNKAAHYRINCGPPDVGRAPDGKFLVFGTNNIIRAGKYGHADAVASTFRMIRNLRNTGALHPCTLSAAMACPNTVVTGRSSTNISKKKLAAHWRSHSTSRFPGIAISVPNGSIVPEVYCSDNRFIMPGVRTPEQLHEACHSMAVCLDACKEPL